MILTDYSKNKLLDLIFGRTAWSTKPSTLYFGLYTATPSDAGGGTEISAGGYARVSKTVGGADFEASTSNGTPVTNKTAIQFLVATAAWGTATHWGMFDASTGGNLIAWGPLPASVAIAINQTVSWAVGDLSFDVGGACGDWLGRVLMNYLFIGTAIPTIGLHYFALGTGASESGISGEPAIGTNSYARKSMANEVATYNAASAGSKTNAALIQFAAATGAWGSAPLTHVAWMSAGGVSRNVTGSSSSGLLLTTAGTAFATTHGSELITSAGHGLTDGMVIVMSNTGGALPAGYSAATGYYVISATTDTFQVALTSGGSAVTISDNGTGTHSWHHAHKLAVGDIVRFANSGGALPTGLVANTDYYVQAIPVANTFRVEQTVGGGAIAYTDAGTGTNTFYPQTLFFGALDTSITPISTNQPQFAAGALTLTLD